MEYDCKICKNTEWIEYQDETGHTYARPCKCQKIRVSLYNVETSGMGDLLKLYTLDRFNTDLPFQKDIKQKAEKYIEDKSNKWFSIFGKSGAGKSHICTAICKELLLKGYEVRFMSWIEESRKLKSIINDSAFDKFIDPYKNAEVLYIDDFFKSENNTPPTNADIKLANEIIGYRYNKARMGSKTVKTIISSEKSLQQLISYDEAILGRIVELSGEYVKMLGDDTINYRLRMFSKR